MREIAGASGGTLLANGGAVMTKTDAARFLMDLSEPLPQGTGPRIVTVQSTPPTKAFVAANLERLEGLTNLQRCAGEEVAWARIRAAFAELEHGALHLGLVHVAKASHAVRSVAATMAETLALDLDAGARLMRQVNTQICALLLRVYVEGDDRNGEPELDHVQSAVREAERQLGTRRWSNPPGAQCN